MNLQIVRIIASLVSREVAHSIVMEALGVILTRYAGDGNRFHFDRPL